MSEKKLNISDNVKYEFSSDWINKLEAKGHWELYWIQQKLLQKQLKDRDKVLEIGLGTGFCANYLKSKDINVTTVDIDKNKNPDIVANIVDFELNDFYNHILAFEVFEHIPYEKFISTLKTLKANSKFIYISIPLNKRRVIDFNLWLPKIHNVNFSLTLPKNRITEKHHFWEVGYKNYREQKVLNDIKNLGYEIITRDTVQLRLFLILKSDK